jgi:uncharacterized protein YecT (DUF1311 family)
MLTPSSPAGLLLQIVSILLVFFATLSLAAAQDMPPPEDRAEIDACLLKQKDSPERCITAVFKPCTEAPLGPNDAVPHDSTARQIKCFNREMAVWDQKMATSLQQLLAGPLGKKTVNPEYRPEGNKRERRVLGAEIISDMQKTWLASRAKICDTESMFYEEGTFSTVVFGNCVLKETGRHVIWLLDVLNDTTGR